MLMLPPNTRIFMMSAHIVHSATPKFAKTLSHKYASMSSKDALDDLLVNHGRGISKKYLQGISESICEIVGNKENIWEFNTVFSTVLCFNKNLVKISLLC